MRPEGCATKGKQPRALVIESEGEGEVGEFAVGWTRKLKKTRHSTRFNIVEVTTFRYLQEPSLARHLLKPTSCRWGSPLGRMYQLRGRGPLCLPNCGTTFSGEAL